MTFLIGGIILAIILDLILMAWLRRRTRSAAPQQGNVAIMGTYSPLLSWIKKQWNHSRLEKGLKPLEAIFAFPPKPSKAEASLSQETAATAPGPRSRAGEIILTLAAVGLAAYPAWLVFQQRWLRVEEVTSPFDDLWCQWRFLCNSAYPPYFAAVLGCLAALLLLVVAWKQQIPAFFEPAALPVVAAPSMPARQFTLGEVPLRQRVFSHWLFLAAAVLALAASLLSFGKETIAGWGFMVALLAYLGGWLAHEIPLAAVTEGWQQWSDVIVAFLLAHLALLLCLGSLASNPAFRWVYGLLLLLAGFNLLRCWRRIPAILWVMNLALVLYLYGVNNWQFSVIGDDYAFFNLAWEIAEKSSLSKVAAHLFDGQAVYGTHPYFSSVLQAISIKLFGSESFGWRLSSLYLAAVGLVLLYLFYRRFVSHTTALLAALLLAGSSYILSFGKIGYNNLQAYFVLALALAVAGWAVCSRERLAYSSLGLSLGLCLYVYPAGLYALPPAALLVLFFDPPSSPQACRRWGVAGLSFFAMLLPLLVQPGYWQAKGPGLLFNNPNIISDGQTVANHLLYNLLYAFFSFLYTPEEAHFVAAAYTDPLTAALVFLGLALVVKWALRRRFLAWFLVSFAAMLFFVGASHDRPFPPTTRMYLLLPWFILFAAVGLSWLIEQIKQIGFTSINSRTLYGLALVTIISLNLYQAFPLSRLRTAGLQTPEVMFVKLAQRVQGLDPLRPIPYTFLFITDEDWSIEGFELIQRVYNLPAAQFHLQRYVVTEPSLPDWLQAQINHPDTLVIVQPSLNPVWQGPLAEKLQSLGKQPCAVKEATGHDTRFTLWLHPDRGFLCPPE